jgi:hypothetical protein
MRIVYTYHMSEHEGDRLSGSVRSAHTNKCYEDNKIILKKYTDKNNRIHHLGTMWATKAVVTSNSYAELCIKINILNQNVNYCYLQKHVQIKLDAL